MLPGPSREGGLERGCVSVAVTLRDTATPTQTKWGINVPLSHSLSPCGYSHWLSSPRSQTPRELVPAVTEFRPVQRAEWRSMDNGPRAANGRSPAARGPPKPESVMCRLVLRFVTNSDRSDQGKCQVCKCERVCTRTYEPDLLAHKVPVPPEL